MLYREHKRLKVVYSDNPKEFESEFNAAMDALSGCEPTFKIDENKTAFCAYITYTETERIPDRVADEYHAMGVYYLCKNCPLHELTTDGRVKRVKCDCSDLGFTHLEHEACEVFYRRLKFGEIKAIGEPREIKPRKKKDYAAREAEYMERRLHGA